MCKKTIIGIIDYDAGNTKSVCRAFDFLNISYCISKNPKDLAVSQKIILPGVGDASYAMQKLKSSGFDSFIKDCIAAGLPFLGICLGSQIIFDYSEEGGVECLALLKGTIRHFIQVQGFKAAGKTDQMPEKRKNNLPQSSLKIPHMGWNDLSYTAKSPLCAGIPEHSDFYFVHSYLIQPDDSSIVSAWTQYGLAVPAIVQYKNIFACQFHPEKSGRQGLKLLENFSKAEALC